MIKFLSVINSFFEGVGKLFDFLNTREIKKAGADERDNEILKEENEILKRQRDNDVNNANGADRMWEQWDDD